MQIKEAMSFSVIPFYETSKIEDVYSRITEQNVAGGLVFNKEEKVIGSFTKMILLEAMHNNVIYIKDCMEKHFRILKEDDSILHISFGEASCNPVMKNTGNISGFITKEQFIKAYSKEANLKLRYYDAIFDSAHNGILSIDREGKIISMNPPAAKMAKTTKEEAIGQFLTDIVLPTGLLEVIRTGKGHTEKYKAGKRIYISNRSPILQKGEVVGAVGVFQDISEIEFISNELESVKNIVNELNIIIENSSDGICIIDDHYEIIQSNEQFQKMFPTRNYDQSLPSILQKVVSNIYETNKDFSILHNGANSNNSYIITGVPIFHSTKKVNRVVITIKDMTEMEKLRDELAETKEILSNYTLREVDGFIYHSTTMKQLVKSIAQVAKVNATVLLTGESGVGKGEVAQLIKSQSERHNKPFVKVNCGAIPETLIESELFGYEPGAFTGASPRGKKGYFEQAEGGTIFLDEIGELSPNLQVKLLNVLQDKEIVRIGAEQSTQVDVRVIAATNKDLDDLVNQGKFREDLFYRLNVVPLYVPPLRERIEDIPLLVQYYCKLFASKYDKSLTFTAEAIDSLMDYPWPGNVRELVNMIERAFIITEKSTITKEDMLHLLHMRQTNNPHKLGEISVHTVVPLKQAVETLEIKLLQKAFQKANTYREVAHLLDVNVSTISRKVNRYKDRL